MESSHRRIINDLEEKHRQEIQRLLCEKEQALAEETQVELHQRIWSMDFFFNFLFCFLFYLGNVGCIGRNA